jgi:hypothetical protein
MNIIADKIVELLQEHLIGRNIRTYRIGNPTDIGKSQLPMVFVQALSESVTSLDSSHDIKEMEFQIGVIVDPTMEYGKAKRVQENAGDRLLMEIVSGRNADYTPMTNTISYVLRNHWTMEGVSFYQQNRTVYGVREVPDAFYKEVHFFITAKASEQVKQGRKVNIYGN